MLWAEVFNADGTRAAEAAGPVLLMSASSSRNLDGAGSFTIEAPLADDDAVKQLLSQKRVYVYTDSPALRLVGAGIITRVNKKMASGGWTLTVDGPDLLQELKFANTLLALSYDAQSATTVLESLLELTGNWTMYPEAAAADILVTARFDGSSVLKAFQTICEQTGLHFRYLDNRRIEVGYFGDWNGITLINPDSSNADSKDIALVDSLSVLEESEDICNWLVPVGAGEGEAALTLRYASGYAFLGTRTTVVNGKTIYYIADDASIAKYGIRKKVVKFDVSPVTNSNQSKAQASGQLYDAALVYLQKNSEPQITYGVTCRKLDRAVLPGDKIRLLYLGPVRRTDGTTLPEEQIDALLWITKVDERRGADEATWRFEVSNIDRSMITEADVVANEIEQAQVRKLKPGIYPSVITYSQSDACSHVKPAEFYLTIDETVVTEIISVKMRVLTAPIWSPMVLAYFSTPTVNGYFLPYRGAIYPLVNAYYQNNELSEQFAYAEGSRTAAYTAEYDITEYVINRIPLDLGHRFTVYDSVRTLTDAGDRALIAPSGLGTWPATIDASGGMIYATFSILAITQAIK